MLAEERPHFSDGEIEVQGSDVPCPRPSGRASAELGTTFVPCVSQSGPHSFIHAGSCVHEGRYHLPKICPEFMAGKVNMVVILCSGLT